MTLAERTDTREAQQVPGNIDAEQYLLGAVLLNNDAYYKVSDFLEPKHFFSLAHQALFEVCSRLISDGKQATPVTLKSHLPNDAEIEGTAAPIYLARLCTVASSLQHARDYGLVIREEYDRRELQRIGKEMIERAGDKLSGGSPSSIIEGVEAELIALSHNESGRSGFEKFSSYVKDALDLASQAYQRDGGLSGLPTGISDLDRFMGGLQKSDLIILAGRPGMGKSALAANIAFNYSKSGGPVGVFSLEMSGEQVATRINAEQAGIPSSRIRRGEINESEFSRLAEAAQRISGIPLHIDQTGGLSLAQVTSRARRLKREQGLDLLIVDYIQLMGGGARYRGQRVQEISEITMGLKALAKELEIPVLALSQLNRQLESRDDKRPQLSDLKESGSIEQDADVVMFVYREEYYLVNKEPREGSEEWFKWKTDLEAVQGKAEIIIGKQRHGPTGKVDLQFDAVVTRFSNLARENVVPFNERGI